MNVANTHTRYCVETIPADPKADPCWCVFRVLRQPGGKTKKEPLIAGRPGVHLASVNAPRALCSFDLALADAEARGLYLGYAIRPGAGITFIDRDRCIGPDGEMSAETQTLLAEVDSYAERSVSQTGLHILAWGLPPAGFSTRRFLEPIEVYPRRGGRFILITGDVLPGYGAIVERADVLARLFPPADSVGSGGSANYDGPRGELTDVEIKAIVKWARRYWTDGRRHHMALYLSGELRRQGVDRKQSVAVIETCAIDDSDPGAKANACEDTYAKAAADISGWYGLKEACGLTDAELTPLVAILDAFWQRTRPRILRVRPAPHLRVREVTHA